MKKRSLFAAVAMLIVSAIVLTSATYAWFATGGSAVKVGAIKGQVATTAAGIKLKVTGASATWQDSLDYLKLSAVNSNHFATQWNTSADGSGTPVNPDDASAVAVVDASSGQVKSYEPISTDPNTFDANGNPTFYGYALNGGNFDNIDSSKALTDFYDVYSFYVGTISESEPAVSGETNVDMTIKIDGSARSAARVAVYTKAGASGSTWNFAGVWSGATETGWRPIVDDLDPTNNQYYHDDNSNFILDSSDSAPTGATAIASLLPAADVTCGTAGPSNTTVNVTLADCHKIDSASGNMLVKVFVWLEGNDANCAPTQTGVPGGDISVTFDFAPAA